VSAGVSIHTQAAKPFIRRPANPKGIFMSLSRPTLTTLLLATAIASSAYAQSGRTRDQVEAEYLEAARTGNVMANGEIGLTLRELFPQNYPAAKPVRGLTREQVTSEMEEAQRTGNIMAAGERGLLNDVNPQQSREAVASGKTRAQVRAELREAIRTGNMVASGESGLMLKDLYPERYANVRPANDAPMQATSSPSATKINWQ
jgi:hypothetical protein